VAASPLPSSARCSLPSSACARMFSDETAGRGPPRGHDRGSHPCSCLLSSEEPSPPPGPPVRKEKRRTVRYRIGESLARHRATLELHGTLEASVSSRQPFTWLNAVYTVSFGAICKCNAEDSWFEGSRLVV
jgi:hypothetical protein